MKHVFFLLSGLFYTIHSYGFIEIAITDSAIYCNGGFITLECTFTEPSANLSWFLADTNGDASSYGECVISGSPVLYMITIDDVDGGTSYTCDVFLTSLEDTATIAINFTVPVNTPSAQLIETVLIEGSVYVAFDISIGQSQWGVFTYTITNDDVIVYSDEGTLSQWDNLTYTIPLLPSGIYTMTLSINNGCTEVFYYYDVTVIDVASTITQTDTYRDSVENIYDTTGRYIGTRNTVPHILPCDVYLHPHTEHIKRITLH